MKKTIKDFDIKGKRVIIRVDFNVPIKDGRIMDDSRIVASLPTIKYAAENGAKVILLSHLGRIKEESDKKKNDLGPVFMRLKELLDFNVYFSKETRGKKVEEAVASLQNGEALLLQNTRYEDLNGKLESNNDGALGLYWASLGDIFINDAFGTAHRAHASNVGISTHLPSGIGFLIEKELEIMEPILNQPGRPFSVILGGSKVSSKIGVIENLVTRADTILIGGGMAYTFLYASGISIGSSLFDKEQLDFCKTMLEKYRDKIILPIDTVCATEINENADTRTCFINEIRENEIGVDIGYNTVKLFKQYLEQSKTILWNGPVGISEVAKFSNGTKALCEVLKNIDAVKVAGGGDTGAAITTLGYDDIMTHISTGGGASLELFEGKKLPGIEAIDEK